MGNSHTDTPLEQWYKHVNQRTQTQINQQEFILYQPKRWIELAIQLIEHFETTHKLESYGQEVSKFLKSADPNKYVGQLAIQVYLDLATNDCEFYIPEGTCRKEEVIYKQIVKQHMIQDILSIWSSIFEQKYSIFFAKEVLHQLENQTDSANFVHQSIQKDVLFFIDYLLNLIVQLYEIKESRKLKQLIIKLILSQTKIRKYIIQFFQIVHNSDIIIFQQKIRNNAAITLHDLNVREELQLIGSTQPYSLTIAKLRQILRIINPGDKFDMFESLEKSINLDIQNANPNPIQWDVDKYCYKQLISSLSIMIYCIIKTQSCEWIHQVKFMESFLGKDISYSEGQVSVQFNKVNAAIMYIMNNL